MISNQNVVRCVVTIGLVLGAALTCFAQLDPIVPDSTQEVRTVDRRSSYPGTGGSTGTDQRSNGRRGTRR